MMTREEAIEFLEDLKKLAQGRLEPINMAIQALKQEQYYKDLAESYEKTINKLIKAIAEQEPILNKIRAEIHATAEMHEDGDYYLREEWIDEIFDKYKAESEDKE